MHDPRRRWARIVASVLVAAFVATDARAACKSACTEGLRACRHECADLHGQARRQCRQRCGEQSTCDAPGVRLRLGMLVVNECTADAAGLTTFKQRLITRRGSCDPVTIM